MTEKHDKHKSHGHKSHGHSEHAHKHVKKHRHAKPKNTNWPAIIIGAAALIIIAVLLLKDTTLLKPDVKEPVSSAEAGEYGSVDLEFYVMSQCPFGTQVEEAIAPVLEELGMNINFRLEFIAQPRGDGTFDSLHGESEVHGNKIHLCVQEYYPKELMDFVLCQNKNYNDFDSTIDSCSEASGLDAAKIKECTTGSEGIELMEASAAKAIEKQAQGSPTMYLNGQLYQGGRETDAFQRAICQHLEGHPNCEGLPACSADTDCVGEPGKIGQCANPGKEDAKCSYEQDAPVKLTVVNVPDCATCDASELLMVLQGVFLNMEVEEVDADSAEGKALVKKYGLTMAPSFVFDDGLPNTYAWGANPRIQGAFEDKDGDYVMLDEASGSNYVLDPKKRAELDRKIGIKKGDNKPQIDFFVMSYCPYGNQAEEGIEPVYRLLGDKADFNVRYVIYSNYGGGGPEYCYDEDDQYCSMHGIQELNQNIREKCVQNHMGTSDMFDFMLAMNTECNYQNADTCWEGVAEDLGLDTSVIEKCEKDEALTYLEEDKELNELLGVRGSPSVFVEGKAYNGGRDALGYAQALCAGFENAPVECNAESLATLGSGTPAAAPAGGCGA
ncbi:DsbA family protein [Nanoarchaeota archaeon]